MKRKLLILFGVATLALTVWAALPTITIGDNTIVVSKTIYTAPCTLHAILGQTTNSASQYIHVYSNVSAMTNGGTPRFAFPIAANQYFFLNFGPYGARMNAIAVCNSTTPWITTLGTSNCAFQAVIEQ